MFTKPGQRCLAVIYRVTKLSLGTKLLKYRNKISGSTLDLEYDTENYGLTDKFDFKNICELLNAESYSWTLQLEAEFLSTPPSVFWVVDSECH